jgi:hypothetical protein
MKHAGEAALDTIEPLLSELRWLKSIHERKRGVFYRQSTAFVHFHEDPAGIFVDVRRESGWERLPVNTPRERNRLMRLVRETLKL